MKKQYVDNTEKKLTELAGGQNPVNKLCRILLKPLGCPGWTEAQRTIERHIVNPGGFWIDLDPIWGEGILFVGDIQKIEIIPKIEIIECQP
jgi:hypothetical protein